MTKANERIKSTCAHIQIVSLESIVTSHNNYIQFHSILCSFQRSDLFAEVIYIKHRLGHVSLLLKNYPQVLGPLIAQSNDNEFPSQIGPMHPLPSTSVTIFIVFKYYETNTTKQ